MSSSTVCGVPSCSLFSTTVCNSSSFSITFRCDNPGSRAGDRVNVRRSLAASTNSSRRTLTPMLPSLSTPRSVRGLPSPSCLKLFFHWRSGSRSWVVSSTAIATVAVSLFLVGFSLAPANGVTATPQAKSAASQGLAVNGLLVVTGGVLKDAWNIVTQMQQNDACRCERKFYGWIDCFHLLRFESK